MVTTYLILAIFFAADTSKISLYEQEVQAGKKIFKVEKKTTEIPIGDILSKKPYTREVALQKFGGPEAERIRLDKLELEKKFNKFNLVSTPLSLLKEKGISKPESLSGKQKFTLPGRITLQEQPLVQGEQIPLEAPKMSAADSLRRKITIKVSAIRALGEIKEPTAKVILKEVVEKGEEVEKQAAAEALASMGDTLGERVLYELLKKEDLEPRIEAIKALGRISSPRSIPALQELLSDKESRISTEAAFSLAKAGDKQGVNVVKKLLSSDNANMRLEAACVLAGIGDTSSAPVLRKEIKNSDADVRYRAVRALGDVGDKSSLSMLNELMRNDNSFKVRLGASESILKLKKEELK